MAEKSRDAFRTISEVADWLDVPTHVLRFWESRFSQIKPVKRAGGRRYYRPSDMRVIGGVKVLLHDQGMTIRGVQRLFREEGIKHISGYAPPLFEEVSEDAEAPALNEEALERAARPASPARSTREAEPAPVPEEDEAQPELPMAREAADEPPMFRRNTKPADEPKPAAEPEPVSEPESVAPAASTPTIPPTPDVPANDVPDNAEDFARPASIAARLKVLSAAELANQRSVLVPVAERLRALADRLG